MSGEKMKQSNIPVNDYIHELLQSVGPVPAAIEPTQATAAAGERVDCVLARIGRFSVLFDKTQVVRLRKLTAADRIAAGDCLTPRRLLREIRSQFLGHPWRQFPSFSQGFAIRFAGADWELYVDSVKGVETIDKSSLKSSQLASRLPFVSGVLINPLRVIVDVPILLKETTGHASQALEITWHD